MNSYAREILSRDCCREESFCGYEWTREVAVVVLADFFGETGQVQKESLSRDDLCLVAPYSPIQSFPRRGNDRCVDFHLEKR
jgi:hypothetical protein